MPYDEDLANRIRESLAGTDAVTERSMFGARLFFVGGHMAVGANAEGALLVRLGQDAAPKALERDDVGPFHGSGTPMKAWVRVVPDGVRTKRQLDGWVRKGVAFAQSLPPKS